MKIYKDIKRIANKLSQVHRLVEKLENTEDFDLYGVEWNTARLVSGLQERKDGLYSKGGRIAKYAFDYYCAQSQGYIEDNYYGHLYFKTDVPGQFVEVWLSVNEVKNMTITIPDTPPSNNLYMGNSHNFNDYRDQKTRWHWLIKAALAKIEKPKQPYPKAIVEITYYFKKRGRRDPDNFSGKMLLDPLVREGVLMDDSFDNVELRLKGDFDKNNPRTEIKITEIKE